MAQLFVLLLGLLELRLGGVKFPAPLPLLFAHGFVDHAVESVVPVRPQPFVLLLGLLELRLGGGGTGYDGGRGGGDASAIWSETRSRLSRRNPGCVTDGTPKSRCIYNAIRMPVRSEVESLDGTLHLRLGGRGGGLAHGFSSALTGFLHRHRLTLH